MDRIDKVEHILGKQGIPSSFSVIKQDEGAYRKHGPWLKKFCAIAGVEYRRPHCLRSSAISELNDSNIGKGRIQHTAGHLDPETTNRYIDHSKADEITPEEANRIYPKPSKYKT